VFFVFDTNALVSAHLIKHSVNDVAFKKALRTGQMVFSDQTFTEFIEVLHRPKFDKYFSVGEREEIIDTFQYKSIQIRPTISIDVCRDRKDNMFLELAVAAKASCIVTGDPDLLVLHPFRSIPILNAKDFLEGF